MVGNKQSVNTILSFGAKSVDPEILEQLLVGRSGTANYFNAVRAIAEDGNNQHILVIEQRGMGKTHLMRILYHRTQKFIIEKKLWSPILRREIGGV
jgi:chromosomal replication initiation ATPase DnaA